MATRKTTAAVEQNEADQSSLTVVGGEDHGRDRHQSDAKHDTETELASPKNLETEQHVGDEPQVEAAKPQSGIQSLLAGIFDQLEGAQAEAADRVAKLEAELETARRDENAISVLLQIRKGNLPTSFAPSDHEINTRKKTTRKTVAVSSGAKAGSVSEHILNSMVADRVYSAGDILNACNVAGTDQAPKYRQSLFAMKKKGEISYSDNSRQYSKPSA